MNLIMLTKCWTIINTKLHKPLIPKENILLISGKYDKYILIEDSDELWLKWDKPERLVHRCGHAGAVLCKTIIRNYTLNFLEKRL